MLKVGEFDSVAGRSIMTMNQFHVIFMRNICMLKNHSH